MNVEGWREVAELEAAAERDEIEQWMSSVSIQEAEARNYGLRNMEIVEVSQSWFSRIRIVLEKRSACVTSSYKNGQVFSMSPALPAKTFSELPKICRAVVISCSLDGRLVVSLEEKEFEQLISYLENSSSPSACVQTRWHLALVGSEVTNRLRQQVLSDIGNRSRHPTQSQLFQQIERAAQNPDTAIVALTTSDEISPPKGTDSMTLCSTTDEYASNAHADNKILLSLNDSQRASVLNSLQSVFSCIHGPPGTGKTTTLAALIRIMFDQGNRILITGPSNISVDNLLQLCVKDPAMRSSCLRLGHPARQNTKLHQYSFSARSTTNDFYTSCREIRAEISQLLAVRASGDIKSCSDRDITKTLKNLLGEVPASGSYPRRAVRNVVRRELQALRSELARREKSVYKDVFAGHRLVFCTCAGAMSRELRSFVWNNDAHFDCVVVDEAGKATVLDALMPCLLGRKVVLAGDHQQLCAIVKSPEALKRGLGVSLMERAVNSNMPNSMLKIQYRMNDQIMSWSSNRFYDGKLRGHETVADRYLTDESTGRSLPGLLWIDTADVAAELFAESEEQGALDTSKFNLGEATVVKHYLQQFLNKGLSIGIIAPYARQVKLLEQLIGDDPDVASICTVDGFQGREADVIIISLVRSNPQKQVGFLEEPTRINVSVTRAKQHCCVIGDSSTVTQDVTLASLFEHCETASVLEKLSYDELDEEIERLQHDLISDNSKSVTKPKDGQPSRACKTMLRRHRGGDKLHNSSPNIKRKLSITKSAPLSGSKTSRAPPTPPLPEFEAGIVDRLKGMNRLIVHKVADELRLHHVSTGEGKDRQLVVRRLSSADRKLDSSPPLPPLKTARDRLDLAQDPMISFGHDTESSLERNEHFDCLLSSGGITSRDSEDEGVVAAARDLVSSPLVVKGLAKQKKSLKPARKTKQQEIRAKEEEIKARNETGASRMLEERSFPAVSEAVLLLERDGPRWLPYFDFERKYDGVGLLLFSRDNYWICPVVCILYLIGIYYGRNHFMKKRQPYNWLNGPLKYWNLALAIFSMFGASRVVPHLIVQLYKFGWDAAVCSPPVFTYGRGAVGLWTGLFIYSKYVELIDTAFIILRKKSLNFLHWYHHVTVLMYTWDAFTSEQPPGLFYCGMNYTVMYYYYYLAGAKARPPKWGIVVTLMQIAQMIGGVGITCVSLYNAFTKPFMAHSNAAKARNPNGECFISKTNMISAAFMYSTYFYLFARFFYNRYVKRGSTKRVTSSNLAARKKEL